MFRDSSRSTRWKHHQLEKITRGKVYGSSFFSIPSSSLCAARDAAICRHCDYLPIHAALESLAWRCAHGGWQVAAILRKVYTPNSHMVTYNPVLKLVSSVIRTTCHYQGKGRLCIRFYRKHVQRILKYAFFLQ